MPFSASNYRGAGSQSQAAAPSLCAVEYYVDVKEAARFLKMKPRSVLKYAREGKLPAHPLDPNASHKDWRFLLSELDAWLRGQVHSSCRSCPASRRIQ